MNDLPTGPAGAPARGAGAPAAPGDPKTLHAAAARHAAARPERTAVIHEDRRTTFGELHQGSNRTAHALLRAGLSRGDRVAYFGKDSALYFEIAIACAKSGTVLVPVNWRLSAVEVEHILRDSGARLVLVEEEFLPVARRVARSLPGPTALVRLEGEPGTAGERDADGTQGFTAWRAGAARSDLDPGTGTDDPVLQVYTSGTTGLPKGVVLAHRSFYSFVEAMDREGADWFDWLPDDVSLVSFPGSYVAGMAWFMHSFIAGIPNVVMRMFVAEEAVRLVERYGVTITFAAPAMLHLMLGEARGLDTPFRSLRKVAYGAAPMPEPLLDACMKVMDCQFAQVYASTESGSVATMLPPSDHYAGSPVLRSAGRACPGSELRICDRQGRSLPAGETGQVWIRTGARMLGYWGLPEETERTLVDGWLLMGDLGYLDERGYLFLRDRINDTIISAGQNIYPAEVENALDQHPAVSESSVVGVPDPQWGEAVRACVVLAPGARATPRELMLHLRGRIADYKIPTSYVFVDTLPRNPSGKVLRRILRERHGDRQPAN
ncbi:fatty-acyl-CoA synthase [Streptomyces puniciscabiei]|uniref:Fatty-acyl-CoA synthase n=1 Tax=Streptomyces puniciscabiei TaxID=164348 RepID=A0A542UH26_9ACTN|nr:long-chain-fatty-acid--CoA ligase [Streptomyces puniciscabiei]TQK98344.1 fatty-acyl-CoA synthase [Streptomyces puniciscabiei]